MKKIGRLLLISIISSSLVVSPVFAEPPADDMQQEQLEQTEDQAEQTETEGQQKETISVDELQKAKKEAETEVKSLEEELLKLMTEVNTLEMNLVETGQNIIKTTEDLGKAQKREKEQYKDMKRRIKAIYEYGDMSVLENIFTSKNIVELLKRAEYVKAVHTYDRKLLKKYVKTKERTSELKAKLEEDMKNQEALQKEYEENKKNLDELLLEKKGEVANIDLKLFEAALAIENGEAGNISDYVLPENPDGGQIIVAAASQFIGTPYVWGGSSLSGIDCSGLVLMAHKAIGVELQHYSGFQGAGGKPVPSMELALPGDVVCYVGHVGIYIGNGQMIHAPQSGDVVKIAKVFGSPWFRRYW